MEDGAGTPWWWPPGSGHTGGRSEGKQANELLSWVSRRLRRIAARKLTPGRPWANAGERATAPADPIMCRPPLTRLSTRRLAHPTAWAVMLSGTDYHKGGACSRALERSRAWGRNGAGLHLCFAQLRSEPTTNPQDWCGPSIRCEGEKAGTSRFFVSGGASMQKAPNCCAAGAAAHRPQKNRRFC